MNIHLISDTHFSHKNLLTFKKQDGSPLRDFIGIHEHDEYLIYRWNLVVKPNDHVYHLGDIGFHGWTHMEEIFSRLHGQKVLIKGNHDVLKPQQYLKIFKDIRGSHQLDKFLLTHIPIHPASLSRWVGNIHGHLHSNSLPDPRYFNVSVEQLNDYTPIAFEDLKLEFAKRNETFNHT